MIALKKEVFETVKRELMLIGLSFLLLLVIFKLVFFKENPLVLFRNVLSLFWLFVLPGYFVMLYWKELEFFERLVIGAVLAAGTIGVASYYLGLIGLDIRYHSILLPLAVILLGTIAASIKE